MNEMLNGHPIWCINAFIMHTNLLVKLCGELELKHGLKSSHNMSNVEKSGIFIYFLTLDLSNRYDEVWFQRYGYD